MVSQGQRLEVLGAVDSVTVGELQDVHQTKPSEVYVEDRWMDRRPLVPAARVVSRPSSGSKRAISDILNNERIEEGLRDK